MSPEGGGAAPAIEVEGLGKRYRLGARAARRETLAAGLLSALGQPLANYRRLRALTRFGEGAEADALWALRDVSFQVPAGQILGVIGANGSGKSTLLKILSRITAPSRGRALLRGRVASLLEVGTGFHPDLSGRDNVYLNGVILGMRRAEIDRNFDRIVDFAGIAGFIDTPIKRYSSGMKVRLAFSVAAHLDAEILLLDEVLAVGDAAFQKRSLGRMRELAGDGRTVIFVSHQLPAVAGLCQRALLLDAGQIRADGPARDVIALHLDAGGAAAQGGAPISDDEGKGYALLHARPLRIPCGEAISLCFEVDCPEPVEDASVGLVLRDAFEQSLLGASSRLQRVTGDGRARRWSVRCDLGALPLNPGRYRLSLWFGDALRDRARFSAAIPIDVTPADPFGWGHVPESWGYFHWRPAWTIAGAPEGLP